MNRRFFSIVALVTLAFSSTLACNDAYPLPPTDCDDWCVATERNDCSEDRPDGCVADCENDRGARDERGCSETWRALSACYRRARDDEFACDNGQSYPTTACLPERRDHAACMAPAGGPCVELCQMKSAPCGQNLRDCEAGCLALPPACGDIATAFYACALQAPVDCRVGGDGDPRKPEQIPCFDSAVGLAVCVGL